MGSSQTIVILVQLLTPKRRQGNNISGQVKSDALLLFLDRGGYSGALQQGCGLRKRQAVSFLKVGFSGRGLAILVQKREIGTRGDQQKVGRYGFDLDGKVQRCFFYRYHQCPTSMYNGIEITTVTNYQ